MYVKISKIIAKHALMSLFGLLYLVKKPFGKKRKKQLSKLIVIDLMGIGDVVCLLPFLHALKQDTRFQVWGCFPKSYIGFMENSIKLDGYIGHDTYIKTINAIRKERFNLLIIPGWALRHSIVALLSSNAILGYITSFSTSYITKFRLQALGYPYKSKLLNMSDLHLSERPDQILDILGVKNVGFVPKTQNPREKNIILHAGADFEGRRWPVRKFAELAKFLIESHHINPEEIFLIGGKQDCGLSSQIIKLSGYNLTDMTGRISLEQTVELLRKSSLFIGNDSGPMHLAWTSGTPTIALMGPNLPSISGPIGDFTLTHFYKQECCPCNQDTCPYNYKCINEISVDEVIASFKKLRFRNEKN
jgi:ADP-heptose:LPS heptosyltransferase